MRTELRKIALRAALAALSIALLTLCGCASRQPEETQPETQTIQTETTAAAETTVPMVIDEDLVEHKGKYYRLRDDQLRVLVMGLDKKDHKEVKSGYTNKMQSDFLLLIIMDKETKECNVLNLNRDIMTEIRRLGFGGAVSGTYTAQLALAHTYGKGGKDSAMNVVHAVSNLLGDIPIDHYMTLTMNSVSRLNDLVGGVTVTVLEDFTAFDAALVKGREVKLTGRQALTYVHGRQNIGDGTNLGRMERQEQYLYAFYKQFLEKSQQGGKKFLANVLLSVGTSFHTDLNFEELNELRKLLPSCKLNPFRSLPGELVMGEKYYEYYVDEEALQDTVIDLFYREESIG